MQRIYLVTAFALAAAALGCAKDQGGAMFSTGPQQRLERVRGAVQQALDAMDADVAAAAAALSAVPLDGPEARDALLELYHKHPYCVDCCTVSLEGVMLAVEPEAHSESEGADISGQEQVQRLQQTQAPVMSGLFPAVEGLFAVDLEHPVFGADGALRGSVSILFQPRALFASFAEPLLESSAWYAWAMQTDGRIIYDLDVQEIGRNVLVDDMYRPFPELRTVARRIIAEPSGKDRYKFLSAGLDRPRTKDCAWTTAVLHNVPWRIILVRETG